MLLHSKVSDVCHLSDEKYPCADLGKDYLDCAVSICPHHYFPQNNIIIIAKKNFITVVFSWI